MTLDHKSFWLNITNCSTNQIVLLYYIWFIALQCSQPTLQSPWHLACHSQLAMLSNNGTSTLYWVSPSGTASILFSYTSSVHSRACSISDELFLLYRIDLCCTLEYLILGARQGPGCTLEYFILQGNAFRCKLLYIGCNPLLFFAISV